MTITERLARANYAGGRLFKTAEQKGVHDGSAYT